MPKEGIKVTEQSKDSSKAQINSKVNLGGNVGLGKLIEKEKFNKDKIAELVANNKISKHKIIRNKPRRKMK